MTFSAQASYKREAKILTAFEDLGSPLLVNKHS